MVKTVCWSWRRDLLPNPVAVQVEEGKLTLARASDIARARARELHPEVMLVAWCDQITGAYSPQIEC
jgi:hypothetical protein